MNGVADSGHMTSVAPRATAVARQRQVAAIDRVGEGGVPLLALRDVALDERDADRRAGAQEIALAGARRAPARPGPPISAATAATGTTRPRPGGPTTIHASATLPRTTSADRP